MAEMTLTAQDMVELVQRLDHMEPELDERQRTLLLAVFSLAGEALAARRQDEVAGFAMPSLTGIVVTTPTNGPPPSLTNASVRPAGRSS